MKILSQKVLVCLIYRLKASLYESQSEKAGCHGSRDNLVGGGQFCTSATKTARNWESVSHHNDKRWQPTNRVNPFYKLRRPP